MGGGASVPADAVGGRVGANVMGRIFAASRPSSSLRAIGNTAVLMVAVPTITMTLSVAISWWCCGRRHARRRCSISSPCAGSRATHRIQHCGLAACLVRGGNVMPSMERSGSWFSLRRRSLELRNAHANSALIQIHRELDEAAQMSGAGTGRVMRSVLLPLLAPPFSMPGSGSRC